MLAPVLAIGALALLGLIAFTWQKLTTGAPHTAIVVVDRRTMRRALRRVNRATTAGDVQRAAAGLTELSVWLRAEIDSGPRRYRCEYTILQTQVDTALAAASNALAVQLGR